MNVTAIQPELPDIHSGENLWIFGYGSLMWRPGFEFLEQRQAVLHGYHRSFCIYSHHHRGTLENPGLVLGLDTGGSCIGCAFEVDGENVPAVVAYLNERELVGHIFPETLLEEKRLLGYAYTPRLLDVTLKGNGPCEAETVVTAYTFVADQVHEHYAGKLSISDSATLIMNAVGTSGLNRDYLINTIRHLEQTGYTEPELHALLTEVENRTGILDIGGGI